MNKNPSRELKRFEADNETNTEHLCLNNCSFQYKMLELRKRVKFTTNSCLQQSYPRSGPRYEEWIFLELVNTV